MPKGFTPLVNSNMNIFLLSLDPEQCAKMHCSKHVVKMILESTQILCAAHHTNNNGYTPPYKLTHKNHPCTVWVRQSITNYWWLCKLAVSLCKEYTYRYGKVHACQQHIEALVGEFPLIPDIGFTSPVQAMPDQYKVEGDPVSAYRAYYLGDKQRMLYWSGRVKDREIPTWVK